MELCSGARRFINFYYYYYYYYKLLLLLLLFYMGNLSVIILYYLYTISESSNKINKSSGICIL